MFPIKTKVNIQNKFDDVNDTVVILRRGLGSKECFFIRKYFPLKGVWPQADSRGGEQ
jgi:hypothetical protein